mgnify:CR=1
MATETTAQKIARLEALLAAGAQSATIEGQSATFDLATVRRQLREAYAEQAAEYDEDERRPVASRILL